MKPFATAMATLVLLAGVACAQQVAVMSRFGVSDNMVAEAIPPSHGVVVLMPGQAAFDAAIAGLTLPDGSETAALRYGVVLQNHERLAVVAYCVQWMFDDGTGASRPGDHSYSNPFALDDGDKPGPFRFPEDTVLDPGDSRLITPVGNYDLKPPFTQAMRSYPGREEVAQLNLSQFVKAEAKGPFKGVRLAGYVLRDGSYVELHPSSLRDGLQASVDGMQDIFQATDRQVFDGSVPDFIASLSAATDRKQLGAGSTQYQYDVDYKMDRDMWLDSVRRGLEAGGYDQMMVYVRQRLYRHRPQIKATPADDSR